MVHGLRPLHKHKAPIDNRISTLAQISKPAGSPAILLISGPCRHIGAPSEISIPPMLSGQMGLFGAPKDTVGSRDTALRPLADFAIMI